MIVRRCSPAGSRMLRMPDGPAVLTLAPLGAEEIEFALPCVRHGPTRRDLETTTALAERCRAPAPDSRRTLRP